VEVLTPAKLNLFLEVLGRRPDGFHEIETLMTPVSLFDSVSITGGPSGELRLDCRWAPGLLKPAANTFVNRSWEPLPQDDANIAMRALRLLRDRAGVKLGATLRIIKRIPSAAGLGGGSSDGAATLVAANEHWGLRWSRDQLAELTAELGSDVPFFLGSGPAICLGRGERITPLSQPRAMHFVIACPPDGLSTAAVYKECQPSADPKSLAPLVDAIRLGDSRRLGESLFNRLESAAARLSPWINRVRDALAEQGCRASQMSGSGTSCFGVCSNAHHARRVAERLRAGGFDRTYSVRSL
jgi:4-diphosphocytidyl-2-C-methyl-D-erythritol kinase